MNIAVIFAGGVGSRMGLGDRPKQFLEVDGKPIIIHTLEPFQKHSDIDAIVIACLNDWINYLWELVNYYGLTKVSSIVSGGSTGQLSIYNGLKAAAKLYGTKNNIVLIHDGVRPVIDKKLISENIEMVKKRGSAISSSKVIETIIVSDEEKKVREVVDRSHSWIAKAPQSFFLEDVIEIEKAAIESGDINQIDTCTLMSKYGYPINIVECSKQNIKITTFEDMNNYQYIYNAMKA